jgi:SAM-dependent methyltransferase
MRPSRTGNGGGSPRLATPEWSIADVSGLTPPEVKVVDYPTGFLADLRSSRTWPSLEGSLWRAPYLARSTFGHAYVPPLRRRRLMGSRASFDVVVVSRVLHHLDDPGGAVADMRRWLRPDGRLVCLDFAYDRFDHHSARWLALVRSLLEAVDAYDTTDLVTADPPAAADQVLQDWLRDHSEHDLRTWYDMASALDAQFVRDHVSWHPYLYWEVWPDLRVPTPAIEEQLAATVMQWEQLWLAEQEIPGVLFLFAGSPRPAPARRVGR